MAQLLKKSARVRQTAPDAAHYTIPYRMVQSLQCSIDAHRRAMMRPAAHSFGASALQRRMAAYCCADALADVIWNNRLSCLDCGRCGGSDT
ncbi:hypothetical protein OPU71_02455 [Niveibacterium sp. 24ML]|uniref:hypothetical protein n=1 Tax=Niveibacterium sp. 24ML TaxID=2985512 RepID=UPI00226E90E5|nr:hypothetical protein [Niveibacterium sp. 24ML]MCX9154982.1 hypothetical protein [Niveibacterium sp. 24ML]